MRQLSAHHHAVNNLCKGVRENLLEDPNVPHEIHESAKVFYDTLSSYLMILVLQESIKPLDIASGNTKEKK